MPSQRRVRFLLLAGVAALCVFYYISSGGHSYDAENLKLHDFYHKTMNAMDRSKGQKVMSGSGSGKSADRDGNIDSDDSRLSRETADRLRAAEKQAKELANQKSPLKPDSPSEVVGVGSSAGGQDKSGIASKVEDDVSESEGSKPSKSKEEHQADVELNAILKKSPVIIFSKTYCPYSKKAKRLLLQKYAIEPAPHVVELDEHALGPQIQALLHRKTSRRTVPNIMVNGVSIGGFDDIAELDGNGQLVPKIRLLGESRRVDMKLRS